MFYNYLIGDGPHAATDTLPEPEMIRLLPEEERHEEFIAVYTGFALSAGENDGGETWTAPDRILWNGETWRVAEVRNWSAFGYVQALAMRMQE